ncbi:MAG: hypothetical protein AMXMBFR45_00210 [Gammaproteobacteria bacterium]|nr:MAG: hypothetical protein BroJett010_22860 [Gammaproteobacteria bacterium]
MVIDRLDVVDLDPLQDLGEQPHVVPGQYAVLAIAPGEYATGRGNREASGKAEAEEQEAADPAGHQRAQSGTGGMLATISQGIAADRRRCRR